ncbi:hypothetical protein BGW36DRAFT_433501 [Talaromyces proteolyticus]|uniref:Uncharacterized protein n=1 Tax=Talaromyces proteolyticus TaxID=1131652 RepID=A0AAD4KEX7_9EURO|nr:uncharacterized protein BGW36DRAFT_433501 [Talaromyces proteolyticus]KAH8689502.1 hypothetical protein BGW36DRAFT_433501 [Talaromyces proteolyticus]
MTDSFSKYFPILLPILSLLSFLPQLRHLWIRKDATGISLYYVFYNLISATEQLTITFTALINNTQGSDFFVHDPPTTGDWINLGQVTVVWLLSLFYFLECLYLPSKGSPGRKRFVFGTYAAFLLISLVPAFVNAIRLSRGLEDPDHSWKLSLFLGLHVLFLNWIVMLMGVIAVYCQAREIFSNRLSAQAFSIIGLASQAVVFIVVAITLTFRLPFPYDMFDMLRISAWVSWYQMVGWIIFDNAIFAVGQAAILWLVTRHSGWSLATSDEIQPLLHD